MLISPRWRKLFGDLKAMQGRIVMMVAAIAAGIFGITTFATSYTILTREISRNYLDTNPASALIDLDRIDPALLDGVRARPDIVAAEAGSIILTRVEARPDEWAPLLLFAVPDFAAATINRFYPHAEAWPPPEGTILLEREALNYIHADIGDVLSIRVPSGPVAKVTVSGTAHDPGLAPSWQEQMVYGYTTPTTLGRIGGDPAAHTLRIVVRDGLRDRFRVETVAADLAGQLESSGFRVGEIRVPPPGTHPHQTQMVALLTMLIIFGFMALGLAAILTAAMINGLLAQQVRQIAAMKAVGARSAQIAGLYLTAVLAIAAAAVMIGLPVGLVTGRGFATVIAQLLNFTLYNMAVPGWAYALVVAAGLLIPLTVAYVPIAKATRVTVREAIADYGIVRGRMAGEWLDHMISHVRGLDRTLVLGIRNAFRRTGRLVLTLLLLTAAGAMFMSSLNVEAAWKHNLVEAAADRTHDLEIRLNRPEDEASVINTISGVPGVARVFRWNLAPAAAGRPDGLTVIRTYPDGGHGSLTLRADPANGDLDRLTVLEGRRPAAGETGAVVLNQNARALLPGANVGSPLRLTVNGRTVEFTLVGIVRQILTPATAYVSAATFDAEPGFAGKVNAVQIDTKDRSPEAVADVSKAIERELEQAGIGVKVNLSEARIDAAVGDHVMILIGSLIFMAVLMAIVGILGLASTQGANVAERTREFGIMRTIGGTSRVVVRNVLAEGVFIGVLSCVLALILSAPLSGVIGSFIGALAFNLPLALTISKTGTSLWLALIVVGSVVASIVPARTASRLTVRETLAQI